MAAKIKQYFNALRVGGNYGFIAQNITSIYYALGLTPLGKELNESRRLFATGLIDAIVYIKEGSITYQNIIDAIASGIIGEVSLGFYSVKHRSLLDFEKNGILIGFAMQLEALIFHASNINRNYKTIVNLVVSQKKLITKIVNKTLTQGSDCNIFPSVFLTTSSIAASSEFQQLVLETDIPEAFSHIPKFEP